MIQINLTMGERRALTAHLDGRRAWARLIHSTVAPDLTRRELESAIKKVTGRD